MRTRTFFGFPVFSVIFLLACALVLRAEEAPPEDRAETPPAGLEADADLMADVYQRLGQPAPKAPAAPADKTPTADEAAAAAAKAKQELETGDDAEEAAKLAAEEEAAEAKRLADEEAAKKAAGKEGKEEGVTEIEVTPEQLAYIEQEVATKTKELTEKLAAAETKAAELETQVQTLGKAPAALPRGLHPLAMVDEAAPIQTAKSEAEQAKAWALKHWDGYEAKEGERSFSKDEVRQLYAQADHELTAVIPLAAQNLQARQQWEPVVKEAYPELTNPKSADYKTMQAVLQACPNLRLFPNYKLLIGDSLAGEQARLARAKAAKGGAAAAGKPGTTVKVKLAPRAPVGAKPGPAGPGATLPKAVKGVPNTASFVKKGATRDALL